MKTYKVSFVVNGRTTHIDIDPRVTLLDALWHQLGLTGTKKGCDHGQCGACTVLLDGRRIKSSLTLAVTHAGQHVTTVEGLAQDKKFAKLQHEFPLADRIFPGSRVCRAGLLLWAARGVSRRDSWTLGIAELGDHGGCHDVPLDSGASPYYCALQRLATSALGSGLVSCRLLHGMATGHDQLRAAGALMGTTWGWKKVADGGQFCSRHLCPGLRVAIHANQTSRRYAMPPTNAIADVGLACRRRLSALWHPQRCG